MSSCDQNHYEIKEDKTGRIVRLDRRTGEVAVLEGDVPHPVSWTLSEGRLVIAGSLTAVV
jgi:hypothetical protein